MDDPEDPGGLDLIPFAPDDDPGLVKALAEAGLALDDLERPEIRFFRIARRGATLGYAGLEIHGDAAILRSVVVRASVRSQGIGRRLVVAMLQHAVGFRIRSVYLLTTTAPGFFAKLGFQAFARDGVPAAIAAAPEFARICPASAVCMMRPIEAGRDGL